MAGLGISFLSYHTVAHEIEEGRLERFDVSWKHQKRPKLLFSINLSDF